MLKSTLLLLSAVAIATGMQLIPPTPEKEIFTGESFVITCQESVRDGK